MKLVSRYLAIISMVIVTIISMAINESCYADEIYYVANTMPPDDYLSLRTMPTISAGQRIRIMRNGTKLQLLQKNPDGWWQVRVIDSGETGWALSGTATKQWILCCAPNIQVTQPTNPAVQQQPAQIAQSSPTNQSAENTLPKKPWLPQSNTQTETSTQPASPSVSQKKEPWLPKSNATGSTNSPVVELDISPSSAAGEPKLTKIPSPEPAQISAKVDSATKSNVGSQDENSNNLSFSFFSISDPGHEHLINPIITVSMILISAISVLSLAIKFQIISLFSQSKSLDQDVSILRNSAQFYPSGRVNEDRIIALARSKVADIPFLKSGFLPSYEPTIERIMLVFENIRASWNVSWSASFGYEYSESYYDYSLKRTAERKYVRWKPATGFDSGSQILTIETTEVISSDHSNNILKNANFSAIQLLNKKENNELLTFKEGNVILIERVLNRLRSTIANIVENSVKSHRLGDQQKDWHWGNDFEIFRESKISYPIFVVKFKGPEGIFSYIFDAMNLSYSSYDSDFPKENLVRFFIYMWWIVAVTCPLLLGNYLIGKFFNGISIESFSRFEQFSMGFFYISCLASVGLYHANKLFRVKHRHHADLMSGNDRSN